jgi:alkanesulfonate monooxygenase SsuD/methylene tetrahydromethanopterin reductase-like flavin-dependent oxidoreductase (luciferase family)
MSHSFRLGFLTHLEGPGDPQRIYQESLELFTAADALGFEVGWIAQHHLQDLAGRLPSPFPFLAAAAERTKRIRLGTAVVILPLENPIRLAEDAAVVDTLSGGRLELGVGSGFDPAAYQIIGVDSDKRRELTTTGLTTLQRAFRNENLSEGGHRLQPPAPTLAKRLWQGVFSEEGAKYAAKHGVGLLLNRATYGYDDPTDQVQLPWAKSYLAAWQRQFEAPRIGLSRTVYPALDKRTAQAELETGVLRFAQYMIKEKRFPAGLSTEDYFKRLHIFYGHPEEVIAGLQSDQVLPLVTDLICQFNPGIPTHQQTLKVLEHIAKEVAPALGWRPQPALAANNNNQHIIQTEAAKVALPL